MTAFVVLVFDQITKLIVVHALDLKTRGGMVILDPVAALLDIFQCQWTIDIFLMP